MADRVEEVYRIDMAFVHATLDRVHYVEDGYVDCGSTAILLCVIVLVVVECLLERSEIVVFDKREHQK